MYFVNFLYIVRCLSIPAALHSLWWNACLVLLFLVILLFASRSTVLVAGSITSFVLYHGTSHDNVVP